MSTNSAFSINDKYTKKEGKIILTGQQALIRIPIDQYYADKAKGLNTATFISGYRGSPLGGIDLALERNKTILDQHNIVFKSGLNEELAATSVWGSQMSSLFEDSLYDGVKGIWYGKGPGVDRTGDAFRHANFAGVGKNGGVLALGGDDPISKSSTIPCASEYAFFDAMMPVLYPGTIQEVIEYGRYGFELSRYSGLWVGFKCTTDLMDGFGTAVINREPRLIRMPAFEFRGKPWQHVSVFSPAPPANVIHEALMEDGRMNAARAFIKVNHLNQMTYPSSNARVGFIAAGKTYYDMIEAFRLLGIEAKDFENLGLRILKLGAIYPIEKTVVHEFAKGLEKVVIVEEKRDLIENQITRILYHSPSSPIIVGKKDANDKALFPSHGETSPDIIANIFTKELSGYLPQALIDNRLAQIAALNNRQVEASLARTPYYCSGCPHNTSTMNLPKDAIVGAGIGCHTMAMFMSDTQIKGFTQMGGEGAQWVGLAPFIKTNHFFQNIGDGTFAHSGSLSVRHAIANETNVTFKILYNEAVAMTGGQKVETGMSVPAMTRLLEAEGVKKIIITTNDLDKYPADAKWASGVERWHRDRIVEAQEILQKIEGVTILIHDQGCSAQLRSQRKKGVAPTPKTRIFINEEVCEGCNDCGIKSNCLSVKAVNTAFGRKNTIDQSSCNLDYSCLKGDCPSFLEIIPDPNHKNNKPKPSRLDIDLDNLPAPKMRVKEEANLYMLGIGGTGVVTVNQILGTAAMLDNKEVNSLDQVGLSQKGGSVISHVKISSKKIAGSNRVAKETADALLGFDIITSAKDLSLTHANPKKTLAIISTDLSPTGQVLRMGLTMPKVQQLINKIEKYTDKSNNVYFDAIKISKALFGNHYPSNIMIVGAAYQSGCIPINAEKIEAAIKINGVKVADNIMAFRTGRKLILNPELITEIESLHQVDTKSLQLDKQSKTLLRPLNLKGNLQKILELRVPELIAYQNSSYAKEYIDYIQKVIKKEQAIKPGATNLSEAVSQYLYKLMAYKDEYEVARLHTKRAAKSEIKKQFGPKSKYAIMLHPPILRAMGYNKKIRFGSWTMPFFNSLASFKFLRGTALDIFGYAKVRKTERALIKDYQKFVNTINDELTILNYDKMVALAKLPDMIRGYEDIKLDNVKKYQQKIKELL